MKKMVKVILAAAAVVALAVPAMAAEKLIVKNAAGTANVFTATDNGWLGLGATPDRPMFIDANSNTLAAGNSSMVVTGEKNMERFELRSFRAATQGPQPTFQGMAARGTTAAPEAVINNTNLFSLIGFGWNGTAYGGTDPAANSGAALIGMYASETHSTTAKGAYIAFQTTKNTTITRNEKLRINGDGSIRLSNQPAAPVSGTTACTVGDMILDAPNGFLYLCTVTGNTWKKATFN